MKRMICVVLAMVMLFSNAAVCHAEEHTFTVEGISVETNAARATKYFSIGVNPQGKSYLSEPLSLDAGETVRINATYSPTNSQLMIGLVDQNGKFSYTTTTNGQIDVTLKIDKRGNYRLAVVNNSTNTVSISGYVYY